MDNNYYIIPSLKVGNVKSCCKSLIYRLRSNLYRCFELWYFGIIQNSFETLDLQTIEIVYPMDLMLNIYFTPRDEKIQKITNNTI